MYRTMILILGMLFLSDLAAAQDTSVTATAYQTVNVRNGPDTRFEIVGQLQQGDSVPVIARDGESNRWLQVSLETDESGWVASFAVIVDGNLSTLPVVSESSATPTGNSGVTVVAYGRVNVRSGPSIAYDIVGELEVEDEAQATARSNENNDWLLVENEQIEGWVAYFTVSVRGDPDTLEILVPSGNGEALLPPSMVTVTRFNVRLHADPERSSPTVTVVPFNSTVTLLGRSDDGSWLYVLYGETPGWGAARLFDLTHEQIEHVPLYNPELTAEPPSDATPEATAET